MKTLSPLWSRPGCVLTFGSVLLAGLVPLLAADKRLEAPAGTSEVKPVPYDLQIINGQLLRPNGKVEPSLANVVDALRDQYTEANITMSPGLSRVTVGDLKLRAGNLREELEAVQVASGGRFEVETPGDTNAKVDPTTGLPIVHPRGINAGLFVLREAPLGAQGRRVVEAFNIGPYLEWLRQKSKGEGSSVREADDQGLMEIEKIILDTIRSFQEDSPEADQPAFQYHPGATLLIVIGKVDSVETARKIVFALPGMGDGPAHVRTQTERELSAEDAFRSRYGLLPRSGQALLPGAAPPDATLKK